MILSPQRDRFTLKIAATILATFALIWIGQQGFHFGQYLATRH